MRAKSGRKDWGRALIALGAMPIVGKVTGVIDPRPGLETWHWVFLGISAIAFLLGLRLYATAKARQADS